jgi:colanic acid/amylovoran biosynthesis protein
MKIGLYGIDGVYNYGCEAIVRGTVNILKMINSDCHIIYYSRRAYDDRIQLKDVDIDVNQISNDLPIFSRGVNKFLRELNINYRIPSDDYKKMCDECDVLISIGGDIYTIPEYLRSENIYPYYNSIVQFGDVVKKSDKRLIVYGASIGPFGHYRKAKEYYFKHLKKADLIIAREKNTIEYLDKNEVKDNVCFLPDPAFFVLDKRNNSNLNIVNNDYIGINLSPLSLKEAYGDVTLEHKKKLALLISNISRKMNSKIMLIPHVISPVNELDNDFTFLTQIAEMIDDDIKGNIRVVDSKGGFIQTKKYLRKCKMVIAVRMHCAINAMCESIPTILLSYSEKSKGMAKFIYGSDEWVLPVNKIEEKLIDKIDIMIKESENIHNCLKERINEIRNINQFEDEINRLLKKIR